MARAKPYVVSNRSGRKVGVMVGSLDQLIIKGRKLFNLSSAVKVYEGVNEVEVDSESYFQTLYEGKCFKLLDESDTSISSTQEGKAKPYVISNRSGRKVGVMVGSLDQLINKGRKLFNLSSAVKVYEGINEVEVNSESYFQTIFEGRCFKLLDESDTSISSTQEAKAKPYVIVDRSNRKVGVVVKSLNQLKDEGRKIFNLSDDVKVYLLDSNVEVDSERYFQTRASDTSFLILEESDTLILSTQQAQMFIKVEELLDDVKNEV